MRQAALAVLTIAPQLLWSEPAKTKGKRRAPYARVRLTRLRCTMLLRGEWLRLLEMPDDQNTQAQISNDHDRSDEDRLAYALKKARQTGNVGKTWLQAQGWGVLPPGDLTVEKVKAKWAPRDELLQPAPEVTPELLEGVLDPEALDKAIRNLNGGTSFDVLGWSHEALQTLHQHHPSGRIFGRWLTALYMQPHMSLPWKLYVASKMVPLKETAGQWPSLRPHTKSWLCYSRKRCYQGAHHSFKRSSMASRGAMVQPSRRPMSLGPCTPSPALCTSGGYCQCIWQHSKRRGPTIHRADRSSSRTTRHQVALVRTFGRCGPAGSRTATCRKHGRSASGRSRVCPSLWFDIQWPGAKRPRPSRSRQQGRV